jgi:photosystem II stability/assembly factor-like uncharacterized protein
MPTLALCSQLVFLFSTVTFVSAAAPLDTWTIHNPPPEANNMRALASGNGLHIVVGYAGATARSADGTNQVFHQSPVSSRLDAMAFGNGRWVAVGSSDIITSHDGTNWVQVPSGTARELRSVVFANNQFVAVGAASVILTSSNGLHWSKRNEANVVGDHPRLSSVAYGNGRYLAVGSAVLTSTDGVTWSALPGYGVDFHQIVFGAGQFLAMNSYLGGPFSTQTPRYAVTTDGLSWSNPLSALDTYDAFPALAYDGAKLIVLGYSGGYGSNFLTTSINGLVWEPVRFFPKFGGNIGNWMLEPVAGRYFSVNHDGGIYRSDNLTNWT